MTKPTNFLTWTALSLLLLTAAGCSATSSGREPVGLTGSIERQKAAQRADDEEPARPVPPDPYKDVRYKGGRDPVTGIAPNLDGQLPPPPAAPARKPAPPRQMATAAPTAGSSIVVQPGDTLSAISRKSGVTVAALMQANNLANPNIVPGQTLTVPAK